MRSTLTFAPIDTGGTHDHSIELRLLRATGAAKALSVPATLSFPMPDDETGDDMEDIRTALIHHFRRLPTDKHLAVMVTTEQAIDAIKLLSDFALTALNPAADRKLADYCELSEDGTEIAFEVQGANSPIVVILNEDRASAYGVRTRPFGRRFIDVVAFDKIDFVPLYLTPEACFRVPALLFAKAKELLENATANNDQAPFFAREDLCRWFWGPAQDQLEDPIVSSSHREALGHRNVAAFTYASGTEQEMKRLLQWAIDINAFTDDSEFDGKRARRPHEPAFARCTVIAGGAHGSARIKPLNVAPRIQRVMMEIVAAFGPRGEQQTTYTTNRLSSVAMGGTARSFGADCQITSAHSIIEATAGLTAFLEGRGYHRDEIDALLTVEFKD